MYLTQSNQIRGLNKEQYKVIKEMCWASKNLYNVALYNIRQYYFQEKKFLNYEANYYYCKVNENYKLLQDGVSQQILKVADRSFKSFLNLIKKAKRGEYRFQDIKLPKYLAKNELFILILSTNVINIKNGYINIPFSRDMKKKYPNMEIKIKFPKRLEGKKIKEIRILPQNNGTYFKIQYVYEHSINDLGLNKDNCLAIDVGLENLATCVDNNGTSFIVDGRKLKSINHYYNKLKSKKQSILDKQNYKYSKSMYRLIQKRNNKANDYIKKSARMIIDYCIENNIGTVIVGYNADYKININPEKASKQQFTQISLGALREQVENLCSQYGISYVEQEESYTSKASFLDNDNIPTFDPHSTNEYKFSGRRIKRGLYKSAEGLIINSDVNGALNIMKKSKQNIDFNKLSIGFLASPIRLRVI
ncbi:RNA-guided endonuclease InsQ/TnpB family protein [Clostridioides difficile]|uniref:RNA-guided endonuclease InsQ/TnpB family protein n=1 Tax=Clostridioides difficile TaxID=1496 RepID=UPI00038CA216|nr:RNA-guided endonuclease TnpB family protein [Clostridioides difficile]EGT3682197.1 transposase [Clostridioides difficile]EGT3807515.1 transposase [Clostridioides difficile]EGT3866501.1 transposase [Clostridioides difficile]EGT4769825.1 transposase [Clostridioides difficile]EGT4997552.1 transposase [Clostridioides difficile]